MDFNSFVLTETTNFQFSGKLHVDFNSFALKETTDFQFQVNYMWILIVLLSKRRENG